MLEVEENTCNKDNKDEYLERNYCSLPLYKATPANGHLRFLMQRLPLLPMDVSDFWCKDCHPSFKATFPLEMECHISGELQIMYRRGFPLSCTTFVQSLTRVIRRDQLCSKFCNGGTTIILGATCKIITKIRMILWTLIRWGFPLSCTTFVQSLLQIKYV
jgi:hypothetical protein